MSTPKLTINLVTFNGQKYLPYCLESIRNQTFKDFSVLVIDNDSHDNTVNFIKQYYPSVRVVENKKNLGFAKAHNQGIHWTKSEYVLCLNQDIFLEQDFLKKAIDFLDTHPNVGSISGKLLRWNFKNKTRTNLIDTIGLKIFKNHRVIDEKQGVRDNEEFNAPREIFGPSGAAPIYRRTALENIKLNNEYFDEDFFIYKEDVDLAYRLRIGGWKSFNVPQAIGYHDRSITKKGNVIANRTLKSQFANYYSYRNHLFVLAKNEYLINLIIYFPYIFWYEFKKFIYLLLFERKTLVRGLDFFKKLCKMFSKRKIIRQNRKISAKELRKWIN